MQAGDEIVKVADGPERLTVAEVDALLYLPNKSRALLERALRVPALSEGWKGSFRELLAKAGATQRRPRRGRASGRCASPRSGARARRSRRSGSPPSTARRGAGGRARPVPHACACGRTPTRLRSSAATRCRTFPTSAATGSASSARARAAATCTITSSVGDVLDVAAPRGSFVLRAGTGPVVLISAGVGATPVLAMLHALAGERSARPVWWLHGARNRDEHAFGARGRRAAARAPGRPPARRLQPPGRRRRGEHRPRRRRPARPRDARAGRRPQGRRLLPVRTRGVHARGRRRADRPRRRARARRHRGVRRGRRSTPPGSSRPATVRRTRRTAHRAPARPSRSSRSDLAVRVGRPLPEPARLRRGVRRPGRLRLSQRRLPQLRERPAGAATSATTSTRSSRRPTAGCSPAAPGRPRS